MDAAGSHSDDIAARLDRLGAAFDLARLASTPCGPREIARYYRVARHAYSRYHDPGNAVHMGLSDGDTFRPGDLAAQPRFVETQLPHGARSVLELATGRGFNALWLARRHPGIAFRGIDLSPAQLAYARRDGAGMANFSAELGDFHDLSMVAPGSVDLVFVVEGLCHSPDKGRVGAEVARVLRPGGRFIVIDGYRARPETACTEPENRALRLLARGMTVGDFDDYRDVMDRLGAAGLGVIEDHDRSSAILPTLRRFEARAGRFLRPSWRARILRALLPAPLLASVVSGYLFPPLMLAGVCSYRLTVLTRP